MKKLAALSLALLFVISLSSCKGGTGDNETSDSADGSTSYKVITNAPGTTVPDTTGETPAQTTEEPTPSTTEPPVVSFSPIDKTAYVIVDNVYVRTEPTTTGNVGVATLHYGDDIKCVGISDNWFKVIYADKEHYIAASCLTFDNITGDDVEAVNDTVYVNVDVLTLRRGPSGDTEPMGYASRGDALTRIGKNEFWSKITHNGNVYYVGNSAISTTPVAAVTTAGS